MIFGVEDLGEPYGVEWMEKEEWKEWLDERFYGEKRSYTRGGTGSQ